MTHRVKTPDGRSTRWDAHRETRRDELVAAAVRAIDADGPEVGIAEIAAAAGVSKPVLYRYFADKDDLYRAVGHWGANLVIEALLPALLSDRPVRDRVRDGVDAYLALLDAHPQVFLLLVGQRSHGHADPLADGKELIAAALTRTLGDSLRALDLDAGGAEPWSYGLLGLGLSTGEWWLTRRTMSRAAVGRYLDDFIWHAFEGIVAEHGATFDSRGRLTLVVEEA